jgi:hypothetical protein
LPTPPTAEQKQKKRTFDVLPNPANLISYRQGRAQEVHHRPPSLGAGFDLASWPKDGSDEAAKICHQLKICRRQLKRPPALLPSGPSQGGNAQCGHAARVLLRRNMWA